MYMYIYYMYIYIYIMYRYYIYKQMYIYIYIYLYIILSAYVLCPTCLTNIYNQYIWSMIMGWTWGLFLVGVISSKRQKFKLLGFQGSPHPASCQFPPLTGHHNLPLGKTLRTVLGLLAVMLLKRVSEIIFFWSNKFTACKVKDEKEKEKSFTTFNLPKIIHPR